MQPKAKRRKKISISTKIFFLKVILEWKVFFSWVRLLRMSSKRLLKGVKGKCFLFTWGNVEQFGEIRGNWNKRGIRYNVVRLSYIFCKSDVFLSLLGISERDYRCKSTALLLDFFDVFERCAWVELSTVVWFRFRFDLLLIQRFDSI